MPPNSIKGLKNKKPLPSPSKLVHTFFKDISTRCFLPFSDFIHSVPVYVLIFFCMYTIMYVQKLLLHHEMEF